MNKIPDPDLITRSTDAQMPAHRFLLGKLVPLVDHLLEIILIGIDDGKLIMKGLHRG